MASRSSSMQHAAASSTPAEAPQHAARAAHPTACGQTPLEHLEKTLRRLIAEKDDEGRTGLHALGREVKEKEVTFQFFQRWQDGCHARVEEVASTCKGVTGILSRQLDELETRVQQLEQQRRCAQRRDQWGGRNHWRAAGWQEAQQQATAQLHPTEDPEDTDSRYFHPAANYRPAKEPEDQEPHVQERPHVHEQQQAAQREQQSGGHHHWRAAGWQDDHGQPQQPVAQPQPAEDPAAQPAAQHQPADDLQTQEQPVVQRQPPEDHKPEEPPETTSAAPQHCTGQPSASNGRSGPGTSSTQLTVRWRSPGSQRHRQQPTKQPADERLPAGESATQPTAEEPTEEPADKCLPEGESATQPTAEEPAEEPADK
jgi:hypothetical protein